LTIENALRLFYAAFELESCAARCHTVHPKGGREDQCYKIAIVVSS